MDNPGTFRHRRSARSIPTGRGSRGGRSHTPEYWREYRARRKAEGDSLPGGHVRGDRSREYARRPSRAIPPIPLLYPDLVRGSSVSYWEDELRIDLAQERALALVEGRDPDEATRRYRAREMAWYRLTAPLAELAA